MSSCAMSPTADYDTSIPSRDTLLPDWDGETIAGYRIHPFASRFPLLTGKAFEDLVASIQDLGIDVPVELSDGLVTDGRNRLRAVDVLRERGVEVEVRTVTWQPDDGRCIEEHIFARNVLRRHLTDDQRAVLATELLPIVRAESAARQAATRFGTVDANSTPPDGETEKPPRSHRDKVNSSTLGRLAQQANVSPHRMRNAIDLADDIKAGLVPEEEREAVLRGEKPLRKAGRRRSRPSGTKRTAVEVGPLEDLFDSADEDEAAATTPENFARSWERLKDAYPVAEHRELRKIALHHIAAEQHQFDRN
jgi:hypothetical protein